MSTIGELHPIRGEFQFEWRIENASSVFINENFEYYSDPFYFADATWKIKMYCSTEEDNISFELKRMSFGLPVKLEYSIDFKYSYGWGSCLKPYIGSFKESSSHIWKGLSRSSLMKVKSYYFPSDAFTLKYTLTSTERYLITSSPLANLLNLADSFKQLYTEERGADLNLNLKGQKFPVHRIMLEARSTIFDWNVSEKKKEEMNIGDINPSSIGAVLDYVYTGDTDQLTKENVLFVYAAADKYGMKQLKKICMAYIKLNSTVEWICEVIKFAVEQQLEGIDQYATKYFIENASKVVETDQWNTFLKENHDKAVELLLTKVSSTG